MSFPQRIPRPSPRDTTEQKAPYSLSEVKWRRVRSQSMPVAVHVTITIIAVRVGGFILNKARW